MTHVLNHTQNLRGAQEGVESISGGVWLSLECGGRGTSEHLSWRHPEPRPAEWSLSLLLEGEVGGGPAVREGGG